VCAKVENWLKRWSHWHPLILTDVNVLYSVCHKSEVIRILMPVAMLVFSRFFLYVNNVTIMVRVVINY